MLRDLHIENLAVVEQASLEFALGLNVLSGETGAGKSIVVDSLALLAGARASSDLIRSGAEHLTVTGVFETRDQNVVAVLNEAGIEVDASGGVSDLVIRRRVSRTGRNQVYVDDRPVALRLLNRLAPSLFRIHGQREELGLATPDLQKYWLDRFAEELLGEQWLRQLESCRSSYATVSSAQQRLRDLTGEESEARLDYLRFQVTEIDQAEVREDEEVELRASRDALRHRDAIRSSLGEARQLLFDREDAVISALARSRQALLDIENWEAAAQTWIEELEELEIRLGELDGELRDRLSATDADPGQLDAVESRLAVLERLFQKHGASSAEVLERRAVFAAEISELEKAADDREALEASVQRAVARFRKAARAVSASRKQAAKALEPAIAQHLTELGLGGARLAIRVHVRPRSESQLELDGEPVEFGASGFDFVTFQFSPNPGEELGPLGKIASGGELSRLYLAVQLAVRAAGEQSSETTLVFDEVDAGIGGAEASILGKKLRRLAAGGQILAVTHLPQVASCADLHFKVGKTVVDGRTRTSLERLDANARVTEVARMLAGEEITNASRRNAREMLREGTR